MNFDVNASYPPLREVLEMVEQTIERAGNPSSVHARGQFARALIEEARHELALALQLKRGDHIIFTSGATEANNLACLSAWQWKREGFCFVTSALEHASILEAAARMERYGGAVQTVPLDSALDITPQAVSKATPDRGTVLASFMLANNETGQLFDIPRLAAAVREKNLKALILCDAVQALGKVDFSFHELGVDFLSLSGHKIGAFSGVGALVLKEGTPLEAQIVGGPQEQGFRAGTENVLGIASFGVALRVMHTRKRERIAAMQERAALVWRVIQDSCPSVVLHLGSKPRLPNTLSIRIPGVRADDLVVALDLKGICVSSGSACASGRPQPSHVLRALGLSETEARETVRISIGAEDSLQAVLQAAGVIAACVRSLVDAGGTHAHS